MVYLPHGIFTSMKRDIPQTIRLRWRYGADIQPDSINYV